MLQVSGIYKDLWRPKDFSSDLLVLKLVSSETVKKLTDIIMIGEDPAAFGSICTSLYLLRLGLYAVNTKFLDANMRRIFSVVLYDMDNQHQKYMYHHQEEHSEIYNWYVVPCYYK